MNKSFIIIFFFLMLLSCGKSLNNTGKEWVISLPRTQNPTTMNQWAVTKYASLKLREEPQVKSKIINYLPIGSVVEIIIKDHEIKNFENLMDYWYYINYNGENGFIFGSYLDIFNTYTEATMKSEEMLFGIKE